MSKATEKQLQFATEIAHTLQMNMPPEESQTKESLRDFISKHIDAYQERKKEILVARIKEELSILDYVVAAGLTPIPVGGQGLYTTKEHDSLRIDPKRNRYFYNSRGDADSIIGFVAKYLYDGDYHRAFMDLSSQLVEHKPIPQSGNMQKPKEKLEVKREKKELQLPEKGSNEKRVYAYLTKTRSIDPDIVKEFFRKKLLYQDTYGNCVFVSYDSSGKPVFANVRGTKPSKRYLKDVVGCDYKQGFYIDFHADSLIVTESVIDAMSIMSILKAKEINYKRYNYIPLSGSMKTESLYHQIDNKETKNILLALDNDDTGRRSSGIVLKELKGKGLHVTEHLPRKKDWNEEVITYQQENRDIAEIDFYQIQGDNVEKITKRKRELERD